MAATVARLVARSVVRKRDGGAICEDLGDSLDHRGTNSDPIAFGGHMFGLAKHAPGFHANLPVVVGDEDKLSARSD